MWSLYWVLCLGAALGVCNLGFFLLSVVYGGEVPIVFIGAYLYSFSPFAGFARLVLTEPNNILLIQKKKKVSVHLVQGSGF